MLVCWEGPCTPGASDPGLSTRHREIRRSLWLETLAPSPSWSAQGHQLSDTEQGGACRCPQVGSLHARGWRAPSPVQTVTHRGTLLGHP